MRNSVKPRAITEELYIMSVSIFKQEALEQSAVDYYILSIAPEQRAIVEGITKIVVIFLDILPVAMIGFRPSNNGVSINREHLKNR